MILEKLKYILLFSLCVGLCLATVAEENNKHLDKIKEMQALIAYERKSIKSLMIDLKESEEGSNKHVRTKKIIKAKHADLNEKIEKLNALIKAVSHSSTVVSKEDVKDIQTLDEMEDEIGIDRDISSVYKKVKKTYKDFRATKENEDWRKKKDDFFKMKEQKKQIIMVE